MIEPLLAWRDANLDGEWEHHHGFDIQTADNPGLIVTLRPRADLGPDRVVEDQHAMRPDPHPMMDGALRHELILDIRIRDGALTGFCEPGRERALIAGLMALLDGRS